MLRRHIVDPLLAALQDTPVVLLHGARQTGKSTLARWIAQKLHPARYLTLDDAAVLGAVEADPHGFLAGNEDPLVIDEVQRAPELFVAIKREVDRHRRPGRFLLTGSANVLLIPRLAESLAGRMEILTLWPLSQGEIAGTREGFVDAAYAAERPSTERPAGVRGEIVERLLRGGYPEIQGRLSADRRAAWFGSYLTTLLQRDVRDLSGIERLAELPRLLALLATRTAGLLNSAELARSAALPLSTLKRYLTLLETTFLLRPLPPWHDNLGKRLVKAPKVMLADTGLSSYLLGCDAERLAEDPGLLGRLLENFVIMELHKQAAWSRVRPGLYHFRTHAQQEVDIVMEDRKGRIVGIEVKASSSVGGEDFKGLRTLAEGTGRRFIRGLVLYTGLEAVSFGKQLDALPVSSLWRLGSENSR